MDEHNLYCEWVLPQEAVDCSFQTSGNPGMKECARQCPLSVQSLQFHRRSWWCGRDVSGHVPVSKHAYSHLIGV